MHRWRRGDVVQLDPVDGEPLAACFVVVTATHEDGSATGYVQLPQSQRLYVGVDANEGTLVGQAPWVHDASDVAAARE